MSVISEILTETSHRPFALPAGRWTYFQEWNNVLFLHWKVSVGILREEVPEKLEIDAFEGDCYVSLVAFTMQKIRPKYFPSIGFISDFDEINIRTYVKYQGKQGGYFLNIAAGKPLSAFTAKLLSGLPYERSQIKRSNNFYTSANPKRHFSLMAKFAVKEKISNKSGLDKWLTERYCLFLDKSDRLYRYDIHHKEWEISTVELKQLKSEYRIGKINLSDQQPGLVHFSDGVKVIAWRCQSL